MGKKSEEVVSKEISNALLGIKDEAQGLEILSAISSFCDADNFMLYALLGAGIITATTARKKISSYRFLVNKEKAGDVALIKSLSLGRGKKEEESQKFSLVASYPRFGGFNYMGRLESLYPMLCRLIIAADRRIVMANPFFDAPGIAKIMPYIKKAAERGVMIRIISRPARDASKEQAKRLDTLINSLGDACEARQFGGTINGRPFHLHAKFMVGDDNMAYVGSANITETSLGNNVEVGVIFAGNEAKALLEFFNVIWKNSEEMR